MVLGGRSRAPSFAVSLCHTLKLASAAQHSFCILSAIIIRVDCETLFKKNVLENCLCRPTENMKKRVLVLGEAEILGRGQSSCITRLVQMQLIIVPSGLIDNIWGKS